MWGLHSLNACRKTKGDALESCGCKFKGVEEFQASISKGVFESASCEWIPKLAYAKDE
jgi:hypothetical protein